MKFLHSAPPLVLAILGGAIAPNAYALWNSPAIQVLRSSDTVFVRSAFSPDHDVVVSVGKGRNGQVDFDRAGLVPEASPMSLATCLAAELVHGCNDEATPWNLNDTYIGANHGWFGIQEITSPAHGLVAPADLGSAWGDEKGAKWYVLKVLDADRAWLMPDNTGTAEGWKFQMAINGSSLARDEDGRKLVLKKPPQKTQLVPSCRIASQQYLVDGKTPLRQGEVVSCSHLDIPEEYDVINPAAVLEMVKQSPGREVNFVGPQLASLLTNRILYRFEPYGACLVEHRSTANAAFSLGYMGFVQSRTLVRRKEDALGYYIPGTLPFTQKENRYDFRAIQDFSQPLPSPVNIGSAYTNIESAGRLPSRFIQLLHRKEGGERKTDVGYALGYSPVRGLTVPATRAVNCDTAITIHTSNKSYPHAIDRKMGRIAAGTAFEGFAYRQYFSPNAMSANATCAYWHAEGPGYVLYVDYHKPVEGDVVRLPKFLVGRSVSVLESSPSVKLLSGSIVPDTGLVLSVAADHGFMVLNLSGAGAKP